MLIYCVLSTLWSYGAFDFSSVCPSGQTLYYVINLDESSVSLFYPDSNYGYTGFIEPVGNVVIPDTIYNEGKVYVVTGISNYAFYNCSHITSVTIPSTINIIGEGVFSYCSSLKRVNIPSSVLSVGDYVFYSC